MDSEMIRRIIALQLAVGIAVALAIYYALTEPDERLTCPECRQLECQCLDGWYGPGALPPAGQTAWSSGGRNGERP